MALISTYLIEIDKVLNANFNSENCLSVNSSNFIFRINIKTNFYDILMTNFTTTKHAI